MRSRVWKYVTAVSAVVLAVAIGAMIFFAATKEAVSTYKISLSSDTTFIYTFTLSQDGDYSLGLSNVDCETITWRVDFAVYGPSGEKELGGTSLLCDEPPESRRADFVSYSLLGSWQAAKGAHNATIIFTAEGTASPLRATIDVSKGHFVSLTVVAGAVISASMISIIVSMYMWSRSRIGKSKAPIEYTDAREMTMEELESTEVGVEDGEPYARTTLGQGKPTAGREERWCPKCSVLVKPISKVKGKEKCPKCGTRL